MKSKASPTEASQNKRTGGSGLPVKRQARPKAQVQAYIDLRGVAGKVIESIRYSPAKIENQSFEVRFSDDTFLFIEPVIELRYRVRHLKVRNGKVESVQDFGVVPKR